MSTTAWLVRNSQTPSEAMTKKAVSSFMARLLTSGVPITPISSATAPRTSRVTKPQHRRRRGVWD